MSLDLTGGSPRRQLKPLILVERARSLKLQKVELGDAQPLEPSPSGTSFLAFPPAIGSPRKIIQNKPSGLIRSGASDGLPTPPQTPTLSADFHGHERGRSTSVLQYHLPFRTIRLSSSPEPTPPEATKELLNALSSESIAPIVSGKRRTSISFTELAHPRDPIPFSCSPPRPASRMSWCSTTSSSFSAHTITASSPAKSSQSHPHHRRSQSYGSPRRVSCDTRGSSGTFGGEMAGSWNSVNSMLDQESVKEVDEESSASQTPTPTIVHSASSSPSSSRTFAIPPFRAMRQPMKQLIPSVPVVANVSGRTREAQLSTFIFPSSSKSRPHPKTRGLSPAPNKTLVEGDPRNTRPPTPISTSSLTSTRQRFRSLPTFMPSKEAPTSSRVGAPRKLSAPAGSLAARAHRSARKLSAPSRSDTSTIPLASPNRAPGFDPNRNTTGSAARLRKHHKPTSPSLPSTMPAPTPTAPISRRQHSVPLCLDTPESSEILARRGSAATVDTADTFGAASGTGSMDTKATGKKSRFRRGVTGMFSRLFLERQASRGGLHAA